MKTKDFVHTPALLQAMADAGPGETCRFPGCHEPRYEGKALNTYNCCNRHRRKLRAHLGHELGRYLGKLRHHGFEREALAIEQLFPGRSLAKAKTLEAKQRYLADRLIAFWNERGRLPTAHDLIVANSMPGCETYRIYFGSLEDAYRFAGFSPKQVQSRQLRFPSWGRISLEERRRFLAAKLREFSDRYNRPPKQRDLVAAQGMPSSGTYLNYFGSLIVAFAYAKIPLVARSPGQLRPLKKVQGEEYTEARRGQLAAELLRFRATHGRVPTLDDLGSASGMPAARTYRNYFGSLRAAFRYAGIPFKELTSVIRVARQRVQQTTKEQKQQQLAVKLREFRDRHGRPPTTRDLTSTNGMPSEVTYYRYFGSMKSAFAHAGISSEELNPTQRCQLQRWVKWPWNGKKRFLAAKLREFLKIHCRVPTQKDLTPANGMPSAATYLRYFRNLRAAFRYAGVSIAALSPLQLAQCGTRKDKKAVLSAKLREFRDRHGRPPQSRDLTSAQGMPTGNTYCRYFGSLGAAFEYADISLDELTPWQRGLLQSRRAKKHRLAVQLRRFRRTYGRAPTVEDLTVAQGMPSAHTYWRYFGSMRAAFRYAGISPTAMSPKQRERFL